MSILRAALWIYYLSVLFSTSGKVRLPFIYASVEECGGIVSSNSPHPPEVHAQTFGLQEVALFGEVVKPFVYRPNWPILSHTGKQDIHEPIMSSLRWICEVKSINPFFPTMLPARCLVTVENKELI